MWWFDLLPACVLAVLVLVVPGTAVLLCARQPLGRAVLLSPPVSLGILVIAAIAAALVGVRWSIVVLAAAVVLALVPLVALGALHRRGREAAEPTAVPVGVRSVPGGAVRGLGARESRALLQYSLGALVPMLVLAYPFTRALQAPQAIAQRFDNAFHLNAIATVMRTGDASPLAVGELVNLSFYPAAWHELVSLVADATGLPVVLAVQAVSLSIVFVTWPLGVSALVEEVIRPSPFVRLLTPAISLGFVAFPWLLFSWGLVYPNILGFAVAPPLLALVLRCIRPAHRSFGALAGALAVVLVGVAGTANAHPSSFLLAGLAAIPFILVRVRQLMTAPERGRTEIVQALILIAVAIGIPVAWVVLAPDTGVAPWSAYTTVPYALGEALLGGTQGLPVVWVHATLTVCGLLVAATDRRLRWFAVSALLVGSVAVVCAGAPDGAVRDVIAGPFYRDTYRTGAALVPVTAVLAVLAVQALLTALGGLLPRSAARRIPGADVPGSAGSSHWPVLASTALQVLLGGLLAWSLCQTIAESRAFTDTMERVRQAFVLKEDSDIVDGDEMIVMERLDEQVPEGVAVVVDPWRGGGLVLAIADRPVTEFYMFSSEGDDDPDKALIRQSLRDVASDPAVCDALADEGAEYYLQMDPHGIGELDSSSAYPGYEGITGDTPGFQEVDRSGKVVLYRITACG